MKQSPAATTRRSVRQNPPEDKKHSDKVISVTVKTSASCNSVNISDSGKSVTVGATVNVKSGNGVAKGKAVPTSSPGAPTPGGDEINTRRKTRSGAAVSGE